MTLRDHLLLLLTVKDELKLREFVEQAIPVAVRIFAVEVVLRPDLASNRRGVLPQVGTVGVADDLGVHS
jgi:hypothetical protein